MEVLKADWAKATLRCSSGFARRGGETWAAECAAAFADGFGEEAACEGGGHLGADGDGAGGLAEDGDVAGISTEGGDVVFDPGEGGGLVEEAVVAGGVVRRTRR